ncbi:MAG: hypothetical protein PVF73_01175, partial [Bacteroidales bacterium]|jgi:hypothetical protein
LCPAGYVSFTKLIGNEFLKKIGTNIENFNNILMPALILIFATIILLQIDNLLRLSLKTNKI